MRISKSAHLKRLLQTQDALMAGVGFAVIADIGWLVGYYDVETAVAHLGLLPFVLGLSAFASASQTPTLHGQKLLDLGWYSARHAVIVVTGILGIAYFSHLGWVSRYVLGSFAAVMFLALLVNRLFLRWWYFRGRQEHPDNFLKVLVIGSGNRARRLMDNYRKHSDWGIDLVGMLDPHPEQSEEEVDGVPLLGNLNVIREVLASHVIDEVVVCVPRSLLNNVGEIVEACQEQAVCLKFMADLYDIPEDTVSLEVKGTVPLLSFDPVSHDEGKLIVKRIFDPLVTMPAVLVLLPFFAVIAVLIKLDSRGPVFFVQPRVGMNKRIFGMIKFRTMHQDAEARLAEIEHLNEAEGPIFKIKNDPRITRVGRWLRKTSIDELPQLFNVLMGRMSLVGPRPMSLRDVERFSLGIQRRRFSVRPGLACLREVSGRSRLSFEKWLQLDLKYIEEWSLWLDLKILIRLIPSVIKGDGAS